MKKKTALTIAGSDCSGGAGIQAKNIVVDPVMVATSGSKLMREETIAVVKEELLPLATLVTPNIPEAVFCARRKISQKNLKKLSSVWSLSVPT